MGRTVICETFLGDYLKDLTKSHGTSVGLLIGQPSNNGNGKDYIVYLNKVKIDQNDEVKDLLEIDNQIVAGHALNVTRNLPGGFYILGIFVLNPKSIFEDSQLARKAKTILIDIKHTFSANGLLQGDCDTYDNGEKLILYYSSSNSNTFACKSFNVKGDNASFKPVDFKFQEKVIEWKMLETYFELDDVFPLLKKSGNAQDSTEDNLNKSVIHIQEQLHKAMIFLDGDPHAQDYETVEKLVKDRKEDISQVHIYMPCPNRRDEELVITKYTATVKFTGTVSSRIFVHGKSTVKEVTDFVKTDLIRSLASRIQIHCDSLVNSSEENQESIILNELPRRVYFPVKMKGSTLNIQFCDYLFREEKKETAVQQVRENLGFTVLPKDIQMNVEIIADLNDQPEQKADGPTQEEVQETKEANKMIAIFGLVAALIILIVSILIHYLLK